MDIMRRLHELDPYNGPASDVAMDVPMQQGGVLRGGPDREVPGAFEDFNPEDSETNAWRALGASRVGLTTLGSTPEMPAGFIKAPNGKELFPPQTALMSSGLRSLIGEGGIGSEAWAAYWVPVEPQWGAIHNLNISVEINGKYLNYSESVNEMARMEMLGLSGATAPLAPGQCG